MFICPKIILFSEINHKKNLLKKTLWHYEEMLVTRIFFFFFKKVFYHFNLLPGLVWERVKQIYHKQKHPTKTSN